MLRLANEKDLDAIVKIDNEVFSDQYPKQHYLYELNENDCANIIVLQINDEIVGFIDYWITFDNCEIVRIAISKNQQGKKYAHQLMQYMIDDAIEKDCEQIFLEVRASNIKAQSLYESHDFIRLSVREKYYSDNKEDAIVLAKAIGGLK